MMMMGQQRKWPFFVFYTTRDWYGRVMKRARGNDVRNIAPIIISVVTVEKKDHNLSQWPLYTPIFARSSDFAYPKRDFTVCRIYCIYITFSFYHLSLRNSN